METSIDPKTRFADDTSAHRMTVLLDQGLYRHLRFAAPANSFSWFEIITVPGLLTINGDMGTFTFARERDMLPLFRRADGSINDYYWTEKLHAATSPPRPTLRVSSRRRSGRMQKTNWTTPRWTGSNGLPPWPSSRTTYCRSPRRGSARLSKR